MLNYRLYSNLKKQNQVKHTKSSFSRKKENEKEGRGKTASVFFIKKKRIGWSGRFRGKKREIIIHLQADNLPGLPMTQH